MSTSLLDHAIEKLPQPNPAWAISEMLRLMKIISTSDKTTCHLQDPLQPIYAMTTNNQHVVDKPEHQLSDSRSNLSAESFAASASEGSAINFRAYLPLTTSRVDEVSSATHCARPPPSPSESSSSSSRSPLEPTPQLQPGIKVPISRLPSMTATRTGPMSSDIVVPARPKPGRKALREGDSNDRRRAQNRTAQRKHRDRRQERLDDTIKELNDAQDARKQSEAALLRNENLHRLRITDLESQLQIANARIRQLEEAARLPNSSTKISNAIREEGAKSRSTISQERHYPPPVDFTSYSTAVDLEMQDDSFNCGFCTDALNCQCKPEKEPKQNAVQAGTCSACRSDPARAAACRQMAATATPEAGLLTPTPSGDGTDTLTATAPGPTISCMEFMDRAHRVAPFPSIRELFGDLVRARPSGSGGYELDEQEAAQGIALLSRSAAS